MDIDDIAASAQFGPGARLGSHKVVRFDGRSSNCVGLPGFSVLCILGGLLAFVGAFFKALTSSPTRRLVGRRAEQTENPQ